MDGLEKAETKTVSLIPQCLVKIMDSGSQLNAEHFLGTEELLTEDASTLLSDTTGNGGGIKAECRKQSPKVSPSLLPCFFLILSSLEIFLHFVSF